MPSFDWSEKFFPEDEVPVLRIRFPDGGDDDIALLKPFNPIPLGLNERAEDVDSCIFHGFLQKEKATYVTVTGCPESNNFQVNLMLRRLPDWMLMSNP